MQHVKMITIQQPWAALVVYGYVDENGNRQFKDVENRPWTTAYQGKLLIHAARKIDPVGMQRVDALGLDVVGTLHRGVMLGSVVLGEIVRDSDSPWARPFRQHWQISEPSPAVRLLEVRGQQGRLFDPPADWQRGFSETDASRAALSRVRDVSPGDLGSPFRLRVDPAAALMAALNVT
ncbi:hypothetical protein ABZ815_20295 [Nonomuraea sp. NPDC047529]|uniref:hypothetical protein n=1 Tax=Nonomuraea sp. NPDC047529 TaxID=3155623 RepID=UPI0033C1A0D8